MRLLTNPGSNLPPSALARYDIVLARQQVAVDHAQHDTPTDLALSVVDGWIAGARTFPKSLGSSAADLVPLFLDAASADSELLVLTSSKRLIPTYQSSLAAAATVRARRGPSKLIISVFDTRTTDLGAGRLAIAAGEWVRAGVTRAPLLEALEVLAERGQMAIHISNLHHAMKSGRASFLKAWTATVLKLRPILGLADGDLRILGRVRAQDDPVEGLVEHLRERVPIGTRVWLGVVHGNERAQAERCLGRLRERYDVAFAMVRPLSSSVYLYAGAGAVGAFLIPVDDLPVALPVPAPAF